MKIAVLSDIHSNLIALEAVLQHMENLPSADKPEEIWFLGDLWGRGPDALEICEWFQTNAAKSGFRWVIGNHDLGVLHELTPEQLMLVADEDVKASWEKNRHQLQELPDPVKKQRSVLLDQPGTERVAMDGLQYLISHHVASDEDLTAAYHYPWTDVLLTDAIRFLVKSEKKESGVVNIYGHTHIPNLASASCNGTIDLSVEKITCGRKYKIDDKKIWLINPGSVGSPRDKNPRASYMVLDTEQQTVVFYRAKYDTHAFFGRMLKKGMSTEIAGKIIAADMPGSVPPDWADHYNRMKEADC